MVRKLGRNFNVKLALVGVGRFCEAPWSAREQQVSPLKADESGSQLSALRRSALQLGNDQT
jgi:hypothetical protein